MRAFKSCLQKDLLPFRHPVIYVLLYNLLLHFKYVDSVYNVLSIM